MTNFHVCFLVTRELIGLMVNDGPMLGDNVEFRSYVDTADMAAGGLGFDNDDYGQLSPANTFRGATFHDVGTPHSTIKSAWNTGTKGRSNGAFFGREVEIEAVILGIWVWEQNEWR